MAPRGFTSVPTQKAEYSFSDFIPTNKQTNKQTNKHLSSGKFMPYRFISVLQPEGVPSESMKKRQAEAMAEMIWPCQ